MKDGFYFILIDFHDKSDSPEKINLKNTSFFRHHGNVYLSIFIHPIKEVALFIKLNAIIIHKEIFYSQNNIFYFEIKSFHCEFKIIYYF